MNDNTKIIKQSVTNAITKHLKSFVFDIKNNFYTKTEIDNLISELNTNFDYTEDELVENINNVWSE